MLFRRLLFKYILTMFDATQKLYCPFPNCPKNEKHLGVLKLKLKLPLSPLFIVLLNYMEYTTYFLTQIELFSLN